MDPPVGKIMKEREVNLGVALSAQIEILRALVEVAQREQQHLIAVETDNIHVCVERRRTLLENLETANGSTEHAVDALRETLNLDKQKVPSLSSLLRHLEPGHRDQLNERCACLESLAQALGELNSINMVHAQRGMRIVRSYNALLADNGRVQTVDVYTKNGRTSRAKHSPGVFARSV
jgi:flagellar biosynthesis/type III secretory pathway chaperone